MNQNAISHSGKLRLYLSSLSFIFFLSGFASLIYQVVWQRLLTLHYGVGAVSITLIVSIYMFGLGVGALLGGFLAERVKAKITLYCAVELLIGCFGVISLPFLDFLGRSTAGSSYFTAFFYMCAFLCVPTLLMGITLPLLIKIFNQLVQKFLETVSFLYFINTAGAAAGALFASYFLISFFGLDNAVYFAAGVNFILAALIFLVQYQNSGQEKRALPDTENPEVLLGRTAYCLVFITGFLAIGYEIVWFRIVEVLVKASPYSFSSVLSVYLMGIALGSYGISRYLRKRASTDKKNLFFIVQFLIGFYVIAVFTGYFYLTRYTSLKFFTRYSFINELHPSFKIPSLLSVGEFLKDLYSSADVFLWPAIFVLVPTIFMGASFPLISSLALSQRNKEGKTIGIVYFVNIAGNVLGGILTGFLLLPYFGTEMTLLAFSSIGVFAGLLVTNLAGMRLSLTFRAAFVLVLVMLNVLFFPKKSQLYEMLHGPGREMYLEEGVDGVVVTYQTAYNTISTFINGLGHGYRPGYVFHYETIEAASFAPKVENVLIIGYGLGAVTETVLKLRDVQKVTIVELSNTLIKNLKKIPVFERMLADSRIDLIIDDGRRFLLRTQKKYDLILLDPLRTTTAYSNNLYSQQFYELAHQHLNPGGVLMVWNDENRVMPKTILSVFNHVRVYNVFCLASNAPLNLNNARREELLNSFSPQEQKHILSYYQYLGGRDYVESVTEGYPINQDWKPVCEYYLGLKIKEKLFKRK